MRPLPRAFYARPAPVVARALVGCVLVHDSPEGRQSGRIVEVEAYRGERDPASHAFRGITPRTRVMFGPPGHAYVYFTYGMHHCINLVCEAEGAAGAVLVRALQPLEGLDLMRERRATQEDTRLARGPGCVTQALGIDRRHDGVDLTRGALFVADLPRVREGFRLGSGPRIGIRVGLDRNWRFWLADHPCVTRPSGVPGLPR